MVWRRQTEGLAAERSLTDADENLKLTLSLARCPSCGKRDPKAVRRFWVSTVAQLGFVAVFILGIAGVVARFDPVSAIFSLWLGAIAAVVSVPVLYLTQFAWKWSTVDARVAFPIPGQSAAAQPSLARPMTPKPYEQVASRLMLCFGAIALALSAREVATIRSNAAPLELNCDAQSMASLENRRWVSVSGCRADASAAIERWKEDDLEAVLIPVYPTQAPGAAPVAFVTLTNYVLLERIEQGLDQALIDELHDRLHQGPIMGMTSEIRSSEASSIRDRFGSLDGTLIEIADGQAPSKGLAVFTSLAGIVLLVLGVAKLPRRRWVYEPVRY